jgi:hypothetical protein
MISTSVYIDKYQYWSYHAFEEIKTKGVRTMDENFAAWMIGGGPRVETLATQREREQLHAFRESQRREHVGLIERLRGIARPATNQADSVTCTA